MNECLNHRLTPRLQHLPAKTSAESANAGKAYPEDFDRLSVKNMHPGFCQDVLNFPNFARLEIMITYNGDAWNCDLGLDIPGENSSLLG